MIRLSRKQFEKAISRAIEGIPEEFQSYLAETLIVAEEKPAPEDLEALGVPEGEILLGAYFGIPIGEKSLFDIQTEPDRISIYKRPMEEMCSSLDELIEEIEITVVHEIAHHFNIDEETLEEYGYY